MVVGLFKPSYKIRQFIGPESFTTAVKYAKQWSQVIDMPICLWEHTQGHSTHGPFYVNRWKDPWPNEHCKVICVYDQGRNNAALIAVLDQIEIKR